jgi:hypothetical protein
MADRAEEIRREVRLDKSMLHLSVRTETRRLLKIRSQIGQEQIDLNSFLFIEIILILVHSYKHPHQRILNSLCYLVALIVGAV